MNQSPPRQIRFGWVRVCWCQIRAQLHQADCVARPRQQARAEPRWQPHRSVTRHKGTDAEDGERAQTAQAVHSMGRQHQSRCAGTDAREWCRMQRNPTGSERRAICSAISQAVAAAVNGPTGVDFRSPGATQGQAPVRYGGEQNALEIEPEMRVVSLIIAELVGRPEPSWDPVVPASCSNRLEISLRRLRSARTALWSVSPN